jgi:ACS family glucarate transporter-like MFS transporter
MNSNVDLGSGGFNGVPAASPAALIPVRYKILGLLFVLSFVNYFLRNNLSVALPAIKDEFHFSNAELGWILGSFNFAYALFNIPGGVFGDVFGSRRALTIIAVSWGVLTAFTGFLPGLMAASAGGALIAFMIVRFLMGIVNAPMFPVAAGAFANWFPPARWALPNAVLSSGLTLGQAALGPIVTLLIVQYGWRESFYILAPVGLMAGAWWWWYGRDTPAEHASVSRDELELINAGRAAGEVNAPERGGWRKVIVHRDVLLLSAAYFCDNYVFYIFSQWLFTYLVEERGFALLESGFLYALPFVVGAVLAAVGGGVCDALCQRIGPRWGCRLPAVVGLGLVAVLLLAGAESPHPYVAVALLSLCFGFTQFIEGPFWAATTYVAGPHTAAATGVLNTGGNLAGFLAPVVGIMLDRLGWLPTLASGSVFAVVGAVLWLFVRVREDK